MKNQASGINIRGTMVKRLRKKKKRRSVNPIVEMSTPSTRIRPSVDSTNLKNDSANVLFPDPVLPRIPI